MSISSLAHALPDLLHDKDDPKLGADKDLTRQTMATPDVNPSPTAEESSVGPVSSSAAPTTQAPTTSSPVVSSTTSTTTSPAAPVSSSSSTSSPVPSSSSSSPSPSSSSTTSSAAATTSSAAPTTSSSTSSSSSTTQPSTQIVTVTRSAGSQPSLLTSVSAAPRPSSSAGHAQATSGSGKGGVGGSGLPVGGLVGIIVGVLAVIIIVALLVTRSMRKRARAKRTANRSSLFEPWPAPVAMEEEPFEKPAYDVGPAQSYPLQNSTELYADPAYPAYGGQAPYQAYDDYPSQAYEHGAYPPQPYADMEQNSAGIGAGAAAAAAGAAGVGAVGAAAGGAAAAASGIHDGMMVRVKVAFVRSLEDELAITPGQQLYLHTAYDDGWTLCEDQAQNRGVVPLSCLEPWEESAPQDYPAQEGQVVNADHTARRRSSLYAPQ